MTSVASSGSEVRVKLPPNWRTARDPGGRLYYYNRKTKEVAWEPPESTESSPDVVIANEKVMEVNQLMVHFDKILSFALIILCFASDHLQ